MTFLRDSYEVLGNFYKYPFKFCAQNTGGTLSCTNAVQGRECLDLSHLSSLALTIEVWESGFKVRLWGGLNSVGS